MFPGDTFGAASGDNAWDVNDTEGNGTYVEGHAPHVFDSGTVKSGAQSSLTATLTDSSKNWSTNQWAGYSVKQTNSSSVCYTKGSYIISNTSNTITYFYYSATDRGPNLKFATGDTYQIHRILTGMDQVGRGKGDLLSGNDSSAINTVTGRRSWPHQALEPAMSWNNVYTPTNTAYGYCGSVPTEIEGRDYYNLGKGLAADSTPSKVSSTYTASLNGIAYTVTYTYPHPLTGARPKSGVAARNLLKGIPQRVDHQRARQLDGVEDVVLDVAFGVVLVEEPHALLRKCESGNAYDQTCAISGANSNGPAFFEAAHCRFK